MIEIIFILALVVIYIISENNKPKNIVKPEKYLNITNPFIEGISQKEFADQEKFVNDIPVNGYSNNPSSKESSILYKKNRLSKDFYK